MSWAAHYISQIQAGKTVKFRPRGGSMRGRIESGQLCTVTPVRAEDLAKGDIVLCKVAGRHYLHLIKAIQGGRFLIGNNRGGTNGWVGASGIYGRCTKIDP